MSNFEGATLVPWQVCRDSLREFELYSHENQKEYDDLVEKLKSETVEHKKWLGLVKKTCTKYDVVLGFSDWFYPIHAMGRLGYCTQDFEEDYNYFKNKGHILYNQILELTNNGKRDAYLNPEQAAFVNRWSK